ncbi:MAG TPA: hypothetical protein ENH82_02735 [bacterium]|nr:hypothetical protein [bacterium]
MAFEDGNGKHLDGYDDYQRTLNTLGDMDAMKRIEEAKALADSMYTKGTLAERNELLTCLDAIAQEITELEKAFELAAIELSHLKGNIVPFIEHIEHFTKQALEAIRKEKE